MKKIIISILVVFTISSGTITNANATWCDVNDYKYRRYSFQEGFYVFTDRDSYRKCNNTVWAILGGTIVVVGIGAIIVAYTHTYNEPYTFKFTPTYNHQNNQIGARLSYVW